MIILLVIVYLCDFVIFVRVNGQLMNAACFKPSQNNIPKILRFILFFYCMSGKRSCGAVV